MAKFYIGAYSEYIRVTKGPLQDENLSLEAKGALVYFQSIDGEKEVNMGNFQADNKIGRDKARRVLKELENSGYLSRDQSQNEYGIFTWTWEFLL